MKISKITILTKFAKATREGDKTKNFKHRVPINKMKNITTHNQTSFNKIKQRNRKY